MSAIDFFSKCFGCGKEFEPGDVRLRFSLDEWERHEGLEPTPDIGIDIGMCADCTEAGNFKVPEIVIPEETKEALPCYCAETSTRNCPRHGQGDANVTPPTSRDDTCGCRKHGVDPECGRHGS
ncbi:MAG: hypothetical protein H0U86_10770 [Chloroflexi bacterium]|nr:hypothetical protein [Chloroflexota bacterium]